jgi:hypothetical protein
MYGPQSVVVALHEPAAQAPSAVSVCEPAGHDGGAHDVPAGYERHAPAAVHRPLWPQLAAPASWQMPRGSTMSAATRWQVPRLPARLHALHWPHVALPQQT